jgi:hypothetical protein
MFDLQADPGESNNVAAQNPEVVRDLEARLLAYSKQQKMSEYGPWIASTSTARFSPWLGSVRAMSRH